MRWLDGITDSMDMSLRTGKPSMLQSIGPRRVRHDLVTQQLVRQVTVSPAAPCVWQLTAPSGTAEDVGACLQQAAGQRRPRSACPGAWSAV